MLINAFASMRRMEIALEVDSVDEVAARISEFLEMRMPEGLHRQAQDAAEAGRDGRVLPEDRLQRRLPGSGPAPTASRSTIIPSCTAGREDGGRFITLPMVFSRNPETGKRNCGMYRMQVYDERTTGMHWQTHKQGAEHYRRLLAAGQADAHGCRGGHRRRPGHHVFRHPAAAARSRRDDDRRLPARQAGRDGEVPDHRSRSSRQCRDRARRLRRTGRDCAREGPFGDHTGFYSLADEYPVFHVTCITQRKDPIYATTIVGPPPMEDFYMGKAIERIFLPLMRLQLPEVRDICMPAEGIFHNLILVSIRKSYPGHARKVMSAIWGLGQAMFTKCIVVVDEDVDVQNVSEVAWKALNNIDPERDIQFTMGPSIRSTMPAAWRITAARWASTPRGNGPAKASRATWPDVIKMSRGREDRGWTNYGKKPDCSASACWLAVLRRPRPVRRGRIIRITHRRIAGVMGAGGADWLVRPERESEEHPDQALDAHRNRAGRHGGRYRRGRRLFHLAAGASAWARAASFTAKISSQPCSTSCRRTCASAS